MIIQPAVNLTLQVKDAGKKISAFYIPSPGPGSKAHTVNVALLGVNILSDVKGGENGGRQLQHDFIVLDFASKPLIKGQSFESGPIELKPSTGDSPGAIVAWVSNSDGSIVQIAGGWLKPSDSSASSSAETNDLTQTSLR